ncbi:MAG: BatA domain-containing protein [Candidatus Marinimicrobia bacterium]|nr:BatA domain-containing protein [Candidatus Neomarinimicrobiota bacterium]
MNFLQPLFLIFTSLAAIPIIIHLISERRYKKYYFSSIKFLKEIHSGSIKKIKIRQLLILLFRVLWILALIFAFSQPFWKKIRSGNSSLENGILIVDNSFSMNIDDQLKNKIGLLKSNFPKWKLMKVDDEHFSTDSVRFLMEEYFRSNGIFNRNVILFSDCQKNKMTDSLLRTIEKSKDIEQSNFIINNSLQSFNANIGTFFIENKFHPLNDFVQINLKANSSIERFDVTPVYLNVNGKRIGQVTLDDKGYGSFSFIPENKGWILGTVTIEGDDYEKDNSIYFSFPVQKTINILNITKSEDENYLSLAFDAIEEINSKIISPAELSNNNIQETDLIILNNIYKFLSAQKKRLIKFAHKKPIVLITGKKINDNYWQKFTGVLKPVLNGNSVSFLTLSFIKSGYNFQQFPESNLRIKKFYTTDKKNKIDIWELSNGETLLFKDSKLSIYTLLSPFDFSWNEFGLSPYFTRLIKSFVHQAIFFPKTNLLLNESIVNNDQDFAVTDPNNEKVRVNSIYTKTDITGFYKMEFNDEQLIYSVNIPESEKTIETINKKKHTIIKWDKDTFENISKLKQGRSLNEFFLVLAAIFFGIEMFILAIGKKF